MSRQRTLLDDSDDPPFDGELLIQMAGVFRWRADGSWWAARAANSQNHGFGPTPNAAMRAALRQPKKRVALE